MASVAIEAARKGDKIVITPHYSNDRFPLFDEVEIDKDGNVRGWAGMSEPKSMQMQELGRYFNFSTGRPYVKLERFDELQVVLKVIE